MNPENRLGIKINKIIQPAKDELLMTVFEKTVWPFLGPILSMTSVWGSPTTFVKGVSEFISKLESKKIWNLNEGVKNYGKCKDFGKNEP